MSLASPEPPAAEDMTPWGEEAALFTLGDLDSLYY
jgi:hypothetical protein